jgi:hypothetical protein
MKIWESGAIAALCLASALDGGEWSATRPCCFTPGGECHWYPLDRRLGGPQSRSGCCGEEKNLALLVSVTIDRVWIGNQIYCALIHTTCN